MKTDYQNFGLIAIGEHESACIAGGIDRSAQQALYTIGYALGSLAGYLSKLYTKWFKKTAVA
ncbi:MAG: hypothetical protein PHD07_01445 [Bacteroidales bacterium]|nr:hypothetical protein [Bacteroidales bacterium]MDD3201740.1 hypothetical protein [Bacteroidales bacterium]